MVLYINIFVTFIHKNTLQKHIETNFIIKYTLVKGRAPHLHTTYMPHTMQRYV